MKNARRILCSVQRGAPCRPEAKHLTASENPIECVKEQVSEYGAYKDMAPIRLFRVFDLSRFFNHKIFRLLDYSIIFFINRVFLFFARPGSSVDTVISVNSCCDGQ